MSLIRDFHYLAFKDTFQVKVVKFIKNDAYCFTEGIPYALIVGLDYKQLSKSDTISILAKCDNSRYEIGETISIAPLENPERASGLRKIPFVTDTILNGIKAKWIIGSEYPAVGGGYYKSGFVY